MKFGLIPINVGVPNNASMLALARKAEDIGLESVWTFEHTMVPNNYASKYPYSASGKMPAAPDTNFIDPLIALSAIAAVTSKIRLGTGVNILPQTNPLLLAKQAASLDLVSDGRFELGVGIGWLREEFEALGTPFERRGARFDDYMTGMRKVWSGETVEHQSDFLNWSGFKSFLSRFNNRYPSSLAVPREELSSASQSMRVAGLHRPLILKRCSRCSICSMRHARTTEETPMRSRSRPCGHHRRGSRPLRHKLTSALGD